MKGFKTFVFGLIVTLLPLLDYINQSDIFSQFIDNPVRAKIATFIVGALIIYFRTLTTTPMFNKDEQ